MIKHWSRVLDGKVTGAMSCEDDYFNTFIDTEPGVWIETNPSMKQGVNIEGGELLRVNFGAIGMLYNKELDAFIFPKPTDIDGNTYNSWTLDENTGSWNPPTECPTDGKHYNWNEETQSWDLITD